ncbi:efflux RND transporter periplasmic adaptor subunit [Candidatus Sumerlaeota bacterium]|nr:efflux RND transporter periplasmic adaptor subunit [Candidatus Sumerlaeota bacterium]
MRIKEMIICCVCLIHLLGIEVSVAKEKAVPVEVIEAKIQKIEQEISVTGDICAFNQVVVYSKVNGVIEELKVEKGDRVKKGDVLAIVEHNMELSQKAQAEAGVAAAKATIQQAKAQKNVALASLKQAEAQLELAKLEKERITQLFKNNTVSKQQYDEVMAKYKVSVATRDLAEANLKAAEAGIIAAEAALQQALAQLKQIEIRIQDYYIRAPISGIISKRFVDEGAMDSPQQPIVEITQMDKVKVITEVAEKDIALIRPGLSAEFNVESYPEKTFTGKVVLIDPTLDVHTRTMGLEIHSENPELLLKPGMFAHLCIKAGERETLCITQDALMRLPGTGVYYVFKVVNGVAEKVNVTLGVKKGNLVEITSGLEPGDIVVVTGQGVLKTGTPVQISPLTAERKQ